MAGPIFSPPEGNPLATPGDYLRATGAELLLAHRHLEAARMLLMEWRCRVPEGAWNRQLPEGGGS